MNIDEIATNYRDEVDDIFETWLDAQSYVDDMYAREEMMREKWEEEQEMESEIADFQEKYPNYGSVAGYAVAFAKIYISEAYAAGHSTSHEVSILAKHITDHFAGSDADDDEYGIIMDDLSLLMFDKTSEHISMSAHSMVGDDFSWINTPDEKLLHRDFETIAKYFAENFGLNAPVGEPWRS